MSTIDDSWYDDLLATVTTPAPPDLRAAVHSLATGDHPLNPAQSDDRRRRWLLPVTIAAALTMVVAGVVILNGDNTPQIGPTDTIPDTTTQRPPTSTAPSPTTTEAASTPTTPSPTTAQSGPAAVTPSRTPAVSPSDSLEVPAGAPADPDWLFTWQDGFLAGVRGPASGRYVDAYLSDGVEEWTQRRIDLPEEIGILNAGIVVSDRLVLTSSSIDDDGRLRLVVASTIDLETWEIDEIVTAPEAVDRGGRWIAITEWGWTTEIGFEGDQPDESWVAQWDGEPRRTGTRPELATPTFSLGDRLIRGASAASEPLGPLVESNEISNNGVDWSPIDLPFGLFHPARHEGGEVISMPTDDGTVLLISDGDTLTVSAVGLIRDDGRWQESQIPGLPTAFFIDRAPSVFEDFNPTSATIITSAEREAQDSFLLATNGTGWLVEPVPEGYRGGMAATSGSFVIVTDGDGWLMFEFT